VECAKLLLAAKASVEIKDDGGWGPQPMSRFEHRFSPAITITDITDITGVSVRKNKGLEMFRVHPCL